MEVDTVMRQFLNYLTWGFLVLFAAPTVMVIASWNSLPGDPLYGFKLGMEQMLLVLVSPSYATQGTLSVKYTERRFSDAKRLLADKGSVEGLAYLDKQVVNTKNIIEKASDVQVQQQLAQTYIDTLKDVSLQLEAEKQAIAAVPPTSRPIVVRPSPVATSLPTPIPTRPPLGFTQPVAPPSNAPTSRPTQPPPIPIPVPAQQSEQKVVDHINQSQQTINDTIKQLENLAVQYQKEEQKQGEKTPEQIKQSLPEIQKEKGKGKN